MKRTRLGLLSVVAVVLLCTLLSVLPGCATTATTTVTNDTFKDIATLPAFGPTEFEPKWNDGKIQSGDNAGKILAEQGYVYSDPIVLPTAKTTITVTISGEKVSNANNDTYLFLSSYTFNTSTKAFTYSNDAAKYTGKVDATTPAKNVDGTYVFTYVTGKTYEIVRLCIPANSDVKITVCYTPDAAATFTNTNTTPWWQTALYIGGIALLIFVFWFFMMRPQKKQRAKTDDMLNKLAVGDEITTISGIIGEIVSIKDETVTIETGRDKVQLRVLRNAIRSVDLSYAEKSGQKTDEKSNN